MVGFPSGSLIKTLSAMQETWVPSLGQEDPLEWHFTPVFLPEESLGQKSLAGYSPQGWKELEMTEVT